jgi:hypothetical protein
MHELNEKQLARQDFVDNCIYDFIRLVAPANAQAEWNIEMIGEIRDTLKFWIVDHLHLCDEETFYPYLRD